MGRKFLENSQWAWAPLSCSLKNGEIFTELFRDEIFSGRDEIRLHSIVVTNNQNWTLDIIWYLSNPKHHMIFLS